MGKLCPHTKGRARRRRRSRDHSRRLGREGIASGVEVYQDLSAIFTVRDGQISKVEYFFGHDRALEAVGLSE